MKGNKNPCNRKGIKIMCNCNRTIHRVTNIASSSTLVNLTVTNGTNVGNLERFTLLISRCKQVNVASNPLPVTITINNTTMPLLDKNGIQIMSNKIPEYAHGRCVLTSPEAVTTSENASTQDVKANSASTQTSTQTSVKAIDAPYVILYTTPKC